MKKEVMVLGYYTLFAQNNIFIRDGVVYNLAISDDKAPVDSKTFIQGDGVVHTIDVSYDMVRVNPSKTFRWDDVVYTVGISNDMIYINSEGKTDPLIINDVIQTRFEFSNYINKLIKENKEWASNFMLIYCPLKKRVRGSSVLIDKLYAKSLTIVESTIYTYKDYEVDRENYLKKLRNPEDDLILLDNHKNRGLVVAVGDENKSCKKGDIIYYREKAGIPYKINGFIYYILWESEIDLIDAVY